MDEEIREPFSLRFTDDNEEVSESVIDEDESQDDESLEDEDTDDQGLDDEDQDQDLDESIEVEVEDQNISRERHVDEYLEMNLTEDDLDNIADTVIDVVRKLLYFFDAEDSEIDEYEGEEQELIFDVVGDNLAVLIGRHGRTLEALQSIVSAVVNKKLGFHYPVVVDIEGYVNRRKQKLIAMARSSAARAIRQKRSVKLRPMSPYERRIVHMALKDDKRIRTESEGVDPNRQVIIYVN